MVLADMDQVARDNFARIHRAALVMSGNPWDADDLAQETFMTAARLVDRFEGRSTVYTWLYGILINLERRERRRHGIRRRKLQVIWDDRPSTDDVSEPPAEAPVEVAQWKQSLWSSVATLPDGQRQAVVLRFSEQLRYQEIAEILECPLGTVKSRIFHGLLTLRRRLEAQGEDLTQVPNFPAADEMAI